MLAKIEKVFIIVFLVITWISVLATLPF